MTTATRRAVLGTAVLTLLLAACARPAGGGASPTAAASGGSAVTVGHTSAGDALAGKDGLTLYVFAKDTGTTPTCTDACAANWPPFTLPAGQAATAGDGVDGAMLGTTAAADGANQVTYNGHPLYYFKGDSAAGEANGQGLNGIWFVAAPDGSMGGSGASAAATPSATEDAGSSGGYGY